MDNFLIVLFKNKKRKKNIKGYATLHNALDKYNSLLKENSDIIFDMKYENAEKCKYEIALLSREDQYQIPLFKKDEFGRQNEIFLETESEYIIKKIDDYKIEEKIQDWQKNKRISFKQFLRYCPQNVLKSIFTVNNKIVIQKEDEFFLFSLKNQEDSHRFLEVLETYFRDHNRNDAIFVRDVSKEQRKWIYDLLIKQGFDRTKLYRQSTTFSKRK
jgi:hypothetical protein